MRQRVFRAAPRVAAVLLAFVAAAFASTSTALAENVHSTYLGGYLSDGSVAFTSGDGNITVPQFTCPASGSMDHEPGIGWVSDGVAALVLHVHCDNGTLSLAADVRLYVPGRRDRIATISSVQLGDVLVAHFRYNSETGGVWRNGRNLRTHEDAIAIARLPGPTTWDHPGGKGFDLKYVASS